MKSSVRYEWNGRQLLNWGAGLIAFATLVLAPMLASAQTNVFAPLSSCTTANCASLTIPGSLLNFGPSAGVWDINVFAHPNECIRLDVSVEGTDLRMVVVAPNGTVYQNDDRASGDNRPLVKIASAPNDGWYTVHLAHWFGSSVNADFALLYGRYTAGNPNCTAPTLPRLTQPLSSKPDISPEVTAPKPQEPGSPD